MTALFSRLKAFDIRNWQALAQLCVLSWLMANKGLDHNIWVLLSLGLTSFFLCKSFWRHQSPLSALNTSLSLLILLRLSPWWLWMVVPFFALGSKKWLTWKGRHVFNPSNFAVVVMLLFFGDFAWIAPGVWARDLPMALFACGAGLMICYRVKVLPAVITFFLSYGLFHVTRSLGLGDPLSIPLHHLQNGSLFVFSFFAFSDPKTCPSHTFLQICYGLMTAAISFSLEFSLFVRGSWFYALFIVNLLIPLLATRFVPFNHKDFSWKELSQSY